jgi:DNA-binding NarL/FixJ family response regulator
MPVSEEMILMDIEMLVMNGLAVTEALHKELPQIKVLILSMYIHGEYVRRVIKSGARGYLLKNAPPEELVRAIAAVHCGETCFSSDVALLSLNQRLRGSWKSKTRSKLLKGFGLRWRIYSLLRCNLALSPTEKHDEALCFEAPEPAFSA